MKRLLLSLSLLCLPLGAQAENKISGSRQKWVKVYQKQGQWNRITIQAKGDTVKTWLNGNPAAHWKNSEYLKGFFSLQIHSGKAGEIHFRNIKVKEL